MVRKERLELSRVTPLEPKSSASTNSATLANTHCLNLPWNQSVVKIPPPELISGIWGERWDSNPRRPESQSGALPTELRSPHSNSSHPFLQTILNMARPTGLEPVTYGLAYPLRLSPPCIVPNTDQIKYRLNR